MIYIIQYICLLKTKKDVTNAATTSLLVDFVSSCSVFFGWITGSFLSNVSRWCDGASWCSFFGWLTFPV